MKKNTLTSSRCSVLALVVLMGGVVGQEEGQRESPRVGGGEASVLDLFPLSGVPSVANKTTCSFKYQASGSRWIEGVDERQVFYASIQGEGFKLGVGKGGQIYSLRGVYGESIPPQRIVSPWNDEVWQAVATNTRLINPIHEYQAEHRGAGGKHSELTSPLMYFIHQAGIYTPGAAEEGAEGGKKAGVFYSPVLRREWDAGTKTLRMVNWMQQANTPCVWKSEVLIYTAFRDLGKGVIEVNQVLHNFGKEELEYFSAPWGGVRKSRMPVTIVSNSDGGWSAEGGLWGWADIPTRKTAETGGWKAWVKDAEDEKSPGLAFVFGNEEGKGEGGYKAKGEAAKRLIRWGAAGASKVRDYQVAEHAALLRVKTGESLSIRWYLVSGGFAQIRARSAQLASQAGVKRISFSDKKTQPLHVASGRLNTAGKGTRWGGLLAEPAPGSVPVFLLKNKRNGKEMVTADLYALSAKEPYPNPLPKEHPEHARYEGRVIYKQYSPHIGYESLLGYAYQKKPTRAGVRKISVPKGTQLHGSAKGLWILE